VVVGPQLLPGIMLLQIPGALDNVVRGSWNLKEHDAWRLHASQAGAVARAPTGRGCRWLLKPQLLGAQSQQAGRPAGRPRVCVHWQRAPAQVTGWACTHARPAPSSSASPLGHPHPHPRPHPHPPLTRPGHSREKGTHTHTAVMQAQAHARTRSSSSRSSRRWPLARSCCQASCRAQAHGFRLRRAALTPGAHRSCCRMHALLDASSISAY